jgi:hypothetical protein
MIVAPHGTFSTSDEHELKYRRELNTFVRIATALKLYNRESYEEKKIRAGQQKGPMEFDDTCEADFEFDPDWSSAPMKTPQSRGHYSEIIKRAVVFDTAAEDNQQSMCNLVF